MVETCVPTMCQLNTFKSRIGTLEHKVGELRKVLADATSILRIALEEMPNGAFRNAVFEEEMPRFERMAQPDGGINAKRTP